MKVHTLLFFIGSLLWIGLACQPKYSDVAPNTGSATNPDWTTESHSGDAPPSYSVAFSQTDVKTMEITMTADQWKSIQTDMAAKSWGTFGAGNTGGVGMPGGNPGGGSFGDDPAYVALPIRINGKLWANVGFRLKGNSSLATAWRSGIYKLPFRLKMDAFEDTYPDIKDQRYYGFKELSMSPGFSDNSLLREKIVADIFRLAGVPAAQTAFYRVYIDFGSGKKYCGVYTMVEVIDDTMVKTQYGEKKGNIYKPESTLQTFVQSQFEKKNNEDKADYSDVQAFVAALNATNRTTDPATWRANLEKTFNMDLFLKYLAVNNTIVNWDSYGAMAHNYYLYNSPTNHLTWIPWDHNMAMSSTAGNGTGGGKAVSLEMTEVSSNWPLIYDITRDPVYYTRYKQYVRDFRDNVFTASNINAIIDQNYYLIAPYVTGTEPEQKPYSYLISTIDFTTGIMALKNHVTSRIQAVNYFLK
ncbi:CotH kinase family protein [Spirosoma aerolatum]|uniref:CotH kinase family protein n=1 Tax=Spirosoma aerolatum TaxID=1211326 RepID=UPI0009ACAD4B|nr:CotH kinase family protein [Spirosoma aerolatum]